MSLHGPAQGAVNRYAGMPSRFSVALNYNQRDVVLRIGEFQ